MNLFIDINRTHEALRNFVSDTESFWENDHIFGLVEFSYTFLTDFRDSSYRFTTKRPHPP